MATLLQVERLTSDTANLRQAYGCFPSGIAAVCALEGQVPVGIAASSFTSVSLNPPLVSVCVQNGSATWPRLRMRDRIGISVLASGQDTACRSLSDKYGDRFADVVWGSTADGALFVHGATLWLDCSIHSELPAGDHAIVLMQVHGLQADPSREPLVFHGSRLRELAAPVDRNGCLA